MFIFNLGVILFILAAVGFFKVIEDNNEAFWKKYLKALGNQLLLPFLGWKTVWDPENKELWNRYLDLKVKKYLFIII